MQHEAESLVITIEDHDTEFPDHVSIDRPESTGLQIVMALVSQIGGSIELERKLHTKWYHQSTVFRYGRNRGS
jgi:two-component sensor histidine kinase